MLSDFFITHLRFATNRETESLRQTVKTAHAFNHGGGYGDENDKEDVHAQNHVEIQ